MKEGDNFDVNFEVTEETYLGFISLFKDANPLHTDQEFAVSRGFEGKVMHGNILNGFLSFFVGECLPMKNVIIHSQTINYKLPVYLNDELIFNARIVLFIESVNSYEFKFSFKNKKEKVVAKGSIQIGVLQ